MVTESTTLPSNVNMGVLLGAGSRDETLKNSGTCFALENVFLKTNVRTNEQMNYGIVQMTGGQAEMKASHEYMLFKGCCLAHDTYDFIQMFSDLVLDEKTVIDEECAMWRVDDYWKLRELNDTHLTTINSQWLSLAYGTKGVGLPVEGYQSNFQNIGHRAMQEFRRTHVTPDRMMVLATGVDSHEEFVNSVLPYFDVLDNVPAPTREPSQYIGGELRQMDEGHDTFLHLSFKGAGMDTPLFVAQHVLATILGNSNSDSLCRAKTHAMAQHSCLSSFHTSHKCFTDAGNWGVTGVAHEEGAQLTEALVQQLNDLRNVSEAELTAAKNQCKVKYLLKQQNPLEHLKSVALKSYFLGGQDSFLDMVDRVTLDDLQNLVGQSLSSPLTCMVLGGDTHDVPSAQ